MYSIIRCPLKMMKACVYKGNRYENGEIWTDLCNTCNCNAGKVECDLVLCKSEFIMIDELSLHADINKDDSEINVDSEMNEDFMPVTMFGK